MARDPHMPDPLGAPLMAETLAAIKTREDEMRFLWSMTAAEREAAMWRGELTWDQLAAWARRAPHEVPIINGEFAFIALFTPEAAESDR
jgi:hypothetical protein